jgi:aspartyl-tRNA(Asn)/glutamyl-tRNA(Gln) amidotransferase subunit B
MEKGQMRVEANISVSKDKDKFGTKVEVKNLNSFKSVERAVAYETERHIALLESGGVISQETRGFDENTGKTFSQRTKEDSHDYRYFPEPDIPKMRLSDIPEFEGDELRKSMPELPKEKRVRYAEDYGLKQDDIEFFVGSPVLSSFFEHSLESLPNNVEVIKTTANYIVSDLAGLMKASATESVGKVFPSAFGKLMQMISEGKLSSRGAKDTLAIIFKDGGEPEAIADANNWILKNDPEALKKALEPIIAENPSIIADYKAGKEMVLNALVGKAMKATGGSYSPQVIKDTLISLI